MEIPETCEPKVTFKWSKYDEAAKTIQVFVQVEMGKDTEIENEFAQYPLHLRVALAGQFLVNEEEFPKERVDEWARVNAPFILYPYVREQIYSLTARCGFSPFLLPLVELPTIRLQPNLPEPLAP